MAGLFLTFIVYFAGAVAVLDARSRGTYFVSTPNMLTRGATFSISVDILNGTEVEVIAKITEKKYNGITNKIDVNVLKTVSGTFTQGVNGHLRIPIEDKFTCGQCNLVIQGRGDQVFERTTHLTIKSKLLSILIQTDKAIYKPGQRVRYRAFAIYPNLKIYKGSFGVQIKDPSNNKIRVLNSQRSESGVLEGFLNLSDEPPFGDWSLVVSVEDVSETKTKSFTVAQYELPRFEVNVQLPSYILLAETRLSGTIKAKYTFGKPVKGMVELHAGPDTGPDHCGKMPASVQVAFEIDGEAPFSIPKSSIQRVMNIFANSRVRITAIVKEEATGVRLNGSSAIQYYNQEHTISFMSNTPSVFKPGLPYTAYVQVKSPDDMPPSEDRRNKIVLYPYATYRVTVPEQSKYGTSDFTGNYALPKMEIEMPANGIVPLNIEIPNNATNIQLQAYYKSISAGKTVGKTYSRSNNYIQLTLDESDVSSGDRTSFRIQGTEPLNGITYEVVSRGDILKTGTISGNGASTFMFDLEVTAAMGPVSNLLIYYIRENAEIVADSIAFNVDGIFENEVSVGFSVARAEPNTPVELRVSAAPASQVFLLAVDQSVLLLKSGNDITTDMVANGVSDQKQLDSKFALSKSAASAGEVFTKSGISYLTDADVGRPPMTRNRNRNRHRSSYGPRSGGRLLVSDFDDARAYGPPSMSANSDFENLPSPQQPMKEVKRIRNRFPEAWLWTDISTLADGTAVINTTVPDTITTWIASAFATNHDSGLGVAKTKANITVFRSFFVSLTYPRIVKRNEKAVIQATVFNYLPQDVPVTVTMSKSAGLQPIRLAANGQEQLLEEPEAQRVMVRSNEQGVVYFPILAKDIGAFDIEIKARSTVAADGVRRQMNVEPEGAPVSYNTPIFIDQGSRSRVSYRKRHSFTFPDSTVAGSEEISVGVSGDLIGPSLDNINQLLSIPTGCGEQSMVRFAPILYVAKYLEASRQMTEHKQATIVSHLESGYQRQLSFRRYDAGFSPFGNGDESGSTWLTAYVSRVLSEARRFIYVDPNVITSAVDWMVERQRSDGAFVELGRVIDPNTQGKDTGPALTAFCLLTLKQNEDFVSAAKCEHHGQNCQRTWKWNNATQKATENLEDNLENIKDPFSLAVVTYALTVTQSRQSNVAFRNLKKMSTSEGGLRFWKGTDQSTTTPAPTYVSIWRPRFVRARPLDILITSYALMSYTARGQVKRGLPIVKWLARQRNSRGGFASTQDTTAALQAFSAYATRSIHANTKLSLTFKSSAGENLGFNINKDNLLNYQTQKFKKMTTNENNKAYNVDVNINGIGFALAEIDFNFRTNIAEPSQSFDVSTVLLDDDLDSFNLMICTKWFKKEVKSGMVVQEIEIPSGFEPDLTSIGNVAGMKRYERKGNAVVLYFDEIVKTSTCYDMLMTRNAKVAQSEKAYINTFSYYSPDDKALTFYHPRKLRESTVCDVCPKCCP